jgi:hypothetical protein
MGVLLWRGSVELAILEPPWRQNQKNISCIPPGKYWCKRVFNRKLFNGKVIPETFEVTDVPNRDGILFHAGNFMEDTRGCLIVGTSFTMLNISPAVSESRRAFLKLLRLTEGLDGFELEIEQR